MSDVLTIHMQSRGMRPLEAVGHHVHSCPHCYEHVPCNDTCSVEPDLTLDDGTPCGAYCVCDACGGES